MTRFHSTMSRNLTRLLLFTASTFVLSSLVEASRIEDLRLEEAHSIEAVTHRLRPVVTSTRDTITRAASALSSAGADDQAELKSQITAAQTTLRSMLLHAIPRWQELTGFAEVRRVHEESSSTLGPRAFLTFHTTHAEEHSYLQRGFLSLQQLDLIDTKYNGVGNNLGELAQHAARLSAFYRQRTPHNIAAEHPDSFRGEPINWIASKFTYPYYHTQRDEGTPWGKVIFLTVPPGQDEKISQAKALLRDIGAALNDTHRALQEGEEDFSFIDQSGPIVLSGDAKLFSPEAFTPSAFTPVLTELLPATEDLINASGIGSLFRKHRSAYTATNAAEAATVSSVNAELKDQTSPQRNVIDGSSADGSGSPSRPLGDATPGQPA